jgi:hypothetical protein
MSENNTLRLIDKHGKEYFDLSNINLDATVLNNSLIEVYQNGVDEFNDFVKRHDCVRYSMRAKSSDPMCLAFRVADSKVALIENYFDFKGTKTDIFFDTSDADGFLSYCKNMLKRDDLEDSERACYQDSLDNYKGDWVFKGPHAEWLNDWGSYDLSVPYNIKKNEAYVLLVEGVFNDLELNGYFNEIDKDTYHPESIESWLEALNDDEYWEECEY